MGLFSNVKELLNIKKSIAEQKQSLSSIEQDISQKRNIIIDLENQIKNIVLEKDAIIASGEDELKKSKENLENQIKS